MNLNQRGDFILYLIVTIVIILIGAILYYVYLSGDSNNSLDKTISDNNFFSEFKSKLPNTNTNTIDNPETFTNSYLIYTKLALDIKLELEDKNLEINGYPSINLNNRIFKIKDPILTNFTGYIDNTGIIGTTQNINAINAILEISSNIDTNYDNIDSIIINNVYLDLESSNINGILNVQDTNTINSDKNFNLNKVYLKMKGFLGNITLTKTNDQTYVEMDGNVGYLQIIDNVSITTLK